MRPSQTRNLILLAVLLALILGSTSAIAIFIMKYHWWKEVGQVETWISMLWYSNAPAAAGTPVAFIALWAAHAPGLHFAGVRRRDFRPYSWLVPVGVAIVAILFPSASINYWTIMRLHWDPDPYLVITDDGRLVSDGPLVHLFYTRVMPSNSEADEIVPVPNGPTQSLKTGTGTNSIACCSKYCKRK